MSYLNGPADQVELYRLQREVESLTIRANMRWRRFHEVSLMTAIGALAGGCGAAVFVSAPVMDTIVGIGGPVFGICGLWALLSALGR